MKSFFNFSLFGFDFLTFSNLCKSVGIPLP